MSRVVQLGFLTLLALLWELASRHGWWDSKLFPPISQIGLNVFHLLTNREFLVNDLSNSLIRLGWGLTWSLPLAVLVAFLSGALKWFEIAISPIINFSFPLPKVALLPLMLVFFGLSDAGKVFLIGLGMFFLIYTNVYSGVLRLRASPIMDVIHVYRIRGPRLWMQIYLKGLIMDLLVGLKGALGYGVTLMVVSEFSLSQNGLGHFIWRSWDSFRIEDMFAGVIILGLIGWSIQTLLDVIIRRRFQAIGSLD